MKGLIYKDLMLLGKQARLLLVIVIGLTGFCAWGGDTVTVGLSFSAIAVLMLSMNCFAYDELAHYDKLVASSPVSKKQVVLARYLSFLVVWGGATGISLLCILAVLLIRNRTLPGELLVQIGAAVLTVLALATVLASVLFPIFYKFGINKSRLVLALICALWASLLTGVVSLVAENPDILPSFTGWNAVLLPALGVAVLALALSVSFSLSVHILEKKEY